MRPIEAAAVYAVVLMAWACHDPATFSIVPTFESTFTAFDRLDEAAVGAASVVRLCPAILFP